MDVDFFKRRQRQLGITSEDLGRAIGRDRTVISKIYSGGRALRTDEVSKFAEMLEISVDDVIEHAGLSEGKVVRAMLAPGFSEQEATPYDWKPNDASKSTLAAAFGFNRPGAEVWTVKGNSMDLAGYVEGDAIVVDRNRADSARAGDDVMAQIYDASHGTAQTVLRRYDPPFLYALSTRQSELKPNFVDGNNVVIVGIIAFSWRIKRKN